MATSDAAKKQLRPPPKMAKQPGAIVVRLGGATGSGNLPGAYPRCVCGFVGALYQRTATTPEDARDACRAAATAGGWRFPDPGPETIAYCPACVIEERDRPPPAQQPAPADSREYRELVERDAESDGYQDAAQGSPPLNLDADIAPGTPRVVYVEAYQRGRARWEAEHAAPVDLTSPPSPDPPAAEVPVTRPARRGIHLAPHLQTLTTLPAPRYVINQVYDIPVGDLMPDPHQPRKLFDPGALRTLGASMRTGGQQQTIRFRERLNPPAEEAPLILVDGERRWRAAQLVGLPTLRAILDPDTDYGADLIVRQALLNEAGQPLQPWDWVLTFHHLARQYNLTPAKIVALLITRGIHHDGRPWTRPQVANYLRLLSLPGWCQDLISEGRLTPSHGLRILPHVGRPAVMERLRTVLGKRCAGTASPAPAADDLDEDRDTEATSGDTAVSDDAPLPFTVADLRREIHNIYYDLYIPLPDGKWTNVEQMHTHLAPRWNCEDPADQCRTCPQRAEIDAWSTRKSLCMDQACMESRNAQHQHDAEQALDPAEAERARTNKQQRDDMKAAFEERIAQAQIECDAIRAAVSMADPEQLLPLLLWSLLSHHARLFGKNDTIPAPAVIARHLSNHTRTRFLRARLAGFLDLRYSDANRAMIREYLGLAAPSPAEHRQDPETP